MKVIPKDPYVYTYMIFFLPFLFGQEAALTFWYCLSTIFSWVISRFVGSVSDFISWRTVNTGTLDMHKNDFYPYPFPKWYQYYTS